MRYLAIDPGVNTGWAAFDKEPDGLPRLLRCYLAQEQGTKYPALQKEPLWPERVIIELPQVYSAQKSKGDPNDLIVLAALAGQYRERFEKAGARVTYVLPRAWKGTLPKEVSHRRILEELGSLSNSSLERYELSVAPMAESLRHNTLDAVGIGLAAFKKGLWPQ